MKIGRNDPCPCGSNKKYKRCCYQYEPNVKDNIPPNIISEIKCKMEQNNWEKQYGQIKPILHCNHRGNNFILIGNELHYSSKWKTFPDFLNEYIKKVLGTDWGTSELGKPYEERHQILKWYEKMCRFQHEQPKNRDGIYCCIPNGAFAAFINLAYDLYVLRNHDLLQSKIIQRLKNKDQFQGARYELFATASICRAGFDIFFEDESDKSIKHPEFTAIHKSTGQKISVEAKSKKRADVLDSNIPKSTKKATKVDVGRLLNQALQKPSQNPFVVFIDLNLPFLGTDFTKPWFKEIKDTVNRISMHNNQNQDKYNMIVFTNFPHHYGEDEQNDPEKNILIMKSNNPLIVSKFPFIFDEIEEAVIKYGNIPNKFPENF